jgi:molecular chaperone DnaK (HSP70)
VAQGGGSGSGGASSELANLGIVVGGRNVGASVGASVAAARSELARVAASAPPVAKVALSRQRFEQITKHLTDRIWGPLREAAEEAGVELADDGLSSRADDEGRKALSSKASSSSTSSSPPPPTPDSRYAPLPRRITRAILVGGGTRVPAVAALVERATGVKPESGIDPEAAVALGAAALAGQLAGLGGSIELGDGAYAPDVHGRASGFD